VTDAEIRLLLADDHPVVRAGLRAVLETEDGMTVVGEAATADEAVRIAADGGVDVVLMDLQFRDGMNGAEATAAITGKPGAPHVLIVTTYDTDADTLPAIEAGATGYLLKDAPQDELFNAVRQAAAGRTVLSPAVASRLVSAVRSPAPSPLAARERQVLELVAKGTSNRDIARELFISEATVKTHLSHVFTKLGVTDRAAAVAKGYEQGILGRD
jgi:DNA-binding NarL/FixJ family response regulator